MSDNKVNLNKINENKIEKSTRNMKELNELLCRATKGDYDMDIADATGLNLLKVNERWSIVKSFDNETASDDYKLIKEVFYIQNPHKYYVSEISQEVYRRIAKQHEHGDKDWADRMAKHYGIDIVSE